jgi:DNA-directed RNA polymerase specialized sigma24 family protein
VASSETSGVIPSGAVSFATTRWSVVAAAGDRLSPSAAEALEILCRAYWYPLYAYVRRKGLAAADAQDVTQEFFHRLIGKNYLESVDRRQGSFRSFLLASVNHLLANEWDKARALKRGGGHQVISFDAEEAEGRFVQEAAMNDSAEKAFDRRWALTLLDRALARLREEFAAAGKTPQFDALKVFLSEVAGAGDYAALAEQVGLDAGGVAVAVHRLRLRYREIVRDEIAQTVATEAELKAEMRHLFASLD